MSAEDMITVAVTGLELRPRLDKRSVSCPPDSQRSDDLRKAGRNGWQNRKAGSMAWFGRPMSSSGLQAVAEVAVATGERTENWAQWHALCEAYVQQLDCSWLMMIARHPLSTRTKLFAFAMIFYSLVMYT